MLMDEVIVDTDNTLINSIESEVIITPNLETEVPVVPSTEFTTDDLVTPSDTLPEENSALAPDAIFSGSDTSIPLQVSEPEENIQTDQQVDNINYSSETTQETNLYNVDDLYTLLNSGDLTVKLQSESETDQLQSESESESELGISDIISKLEENRLFESEALQAINDNIVHANNNDNIIGFISISLLASLLGGIVAIGFLKGLK